MAQYVYGKNVVISLLKSDKEVTALFLQENHNDPLVEKLAQEVSIPVYRKSKKELDKMVKGLHQGYLAQIKEYKTYSIEEIINSIPNDRLPLIVALDSLEDPHNLGAILRTAECVGADGVIIEQNRSVSLNQTVAKVSVGAINTVKVAQVTNLNQTLNKLKEKGYWIVGTDSNKAQDYRSVDYNIPLVLVIGSEGKGMHRLVKQNCDWIVKLPMEGTVGSLNASVATGILLYEIYSQRFPLE